METVGGNNGAGLTQRAQRRKERESRRPPASNFMIVWTPVSKTNRYRLQ